MITTNNNNELLLSHFDYYLPPNLIAQKPTINRTESRLLHLDEHGNLYDKKFIELGTLLNPGDLLIFNNTQVIKARLHGHKITGGKVEVLIERILDQATVLAHIRSSKAPKVNSTIIINDTVKATVLGRQENLFKLEFNDIVDNVLDQHGHMPLPPYITRQADGTDDSRYQTVYAQQPGAVAAPTAGLHFDDNLLEKLSDAGIKQAFITLHVGAATFQPVRTNKINDHEMHSERYTVDAKTIQAIQQTKQNGGRVIAIGTTSARALESAAAGIKQDTRLFITPGYQFKWVDALLTNFHLPQSTLLMMVSALAGITPIKNAYQHAIKQNYRFFSYGDAMFIETPSNVQN